MMRKAETGMAQAGWLSEKPARKIVIRERQEDAELIRKQATAPSLMNQRALVTVPPPILPFGSTVRPQSSGLFFNEPPWPVLFAFWCRAFRVPLRRFLVIPRFLSLALL